MKKEVSLRLSEVKIIGFKPIKTEELVLKNSFTFKDFCNAIKEKFNTFDRKQYTIFLPNQGGVCVNRHNF